MRRTRNNPEAGFTFLELVVVMGIMAVVALVAIPAWQHFTRSMALRGSALQLASLLRYAQLNAVESGEARHVVIDCVAGAYRLLPLAPDEEEEAATEVKAASDWERTRTLPLAVQVALVPDEESDAMADAADSVELVFYPDGTASPATVELSGQTGAYRISVRAATGLVQVERRSTQEAQDEPHA